MAAPSLSFRSRSLSLTTVVEEEGEGIEGGGRRRAAERLAPECEKTPVSRGVRRKRLLLPLFTLVRPTPPSRPRSSPARIIYRRIVVVVFLFLFFFFFVFLLWGLPTLDPHLLGGSNLFRGVVADAFQLYDVRVDISRDKY